MRSDQRNPASGLRAAFTIFAMLLCAGCATTSFKKSVEITPPGERIDEVVALYVPPETRGYLNKNFVNIVPYTVRFGEGIDLSAEAALRHIFSDVVRVDGFPSTLLHAGVPLRTITIEIAGSKISQGRLTFLPTTAEIELLIHVSGGNSVADPKTLPVRGSGEASAGPEGYILFVNQVAWKRSVNKACELAVKDALTKMVAAITAELSADHGNET